MGEESKEKYVELKEAVANRSPKELGTVVKKSEVIYHHEITNQNLWNKF
jgi:glutamine synthetase